MSNPYEILGRIPPVNEAEIRHEKVQIGKDQEKAQSEEDSHSKNRGGKKSKLTIRYLYHKTYRKPNEQLIIFPIGGHSVTLT